MTLLHYIALIVKEKYPELANFYNELHFVDKAAAGEALIEVMSSESSVLASVFLFIYLFVIIGRDIRILNIISCPQCLWKMSCWMFESWAKAWS